MIASTKKYVVFFIIFLSCHSTAFSMETITVNQIKDLVLYKNQQKKSNKKNFSIFDGLFINSDEIAQKLLDKCTALKSKEIITNEDIASVKKLWDLFETLHNYDWLDCILHPLQKKADCAYDPSKKYVNDKLYKKIAPILHLDKNTTKNKKIINEFSKILIHCQNTSRPTKPFDHHTKSISRDIIEQAFDTIEDIINKTLPHLCKEKEYKFYNEETKKIETISNPDYRMSYTKEAQQYQKVTLDNYIQMKQSLTPFNKNKEKHVI